MFKKISITFLILPFFAAQAAPLDPIKARRQLRDTLLSAIDAVELQVRETANSDMFSETTAGVMLGAMVLPMIFQVFGDEGSSSFDTLKTMLKANVLDHLFDEKMMVAQNDTSASFGLSPELCDKFALIAHEYNEEHISKCRSFLTENQIALKLAQFAEQDIQVQVLFNTNPARGEFVTALDVSKTSLGIEVNLEQLRSFFDRLKESQNIDRDTLRGIDTFSGVLKFGVRFKNLQLESGCKSNGGICIVAEVVESVKVGSSNPDDMLVLEFDVSDKKGPTIELSANGESSFFLGLNLGRISLNAGENRSFNMAGLYTDAMVPKEGGSGRSSLKLLGLSFGNGPVSLVYNSLSYAVDLNANTDRIVNALSLVWDEFSGVFLETTGVNLRVRMIDNSKEDCRAIEEGQFSLSGKGTGNVRVRLNSNFESSHDEDILAGCNLADQLQFYLFDKMVNSPCTEESVLKVEEGSLWFDHNYAVNDAAGSSSLQANEGECIGLPTSVENKDEL